MVEKPSGKRGLYALYALILGALAGELLIVAFATTTKSGLRVLGVASMVAAASALAGAVFGFIFGVPRTLQRTTEDDGGSTTTSFESNNRQPYKPNTNLEQISDWLTKILVGVGLIQIGNIRGSLKDLGTTLAPGLGGADTAPFATATIICYVLNGFLIGYLWTRLYFAGALVEADDLEALSREVKGIKEQSDLDARALALLVKQLNPSTDTQTPTQSELNEAIRVSSQNVRAQIYYQAQRVRQETWAEQSTKAQMERTIPIFRALIAADTDDAYHEYHGQLGFALKDQRAPELSAAEASLTKAIQLRASAQKQSWAFYEMCRAECRIMLDANLKESKKSSPDLRQRILEDLMVAASNVDTRRIIFSDDPFKQWMNLNEVGPQELKT